MQMRGALELVHAETGWQGLVNANKRGTGACACGNGVLDACRYEQGGCWGSCSWKLGVRCSSRRTEWALGLVYMETGHLMRLFMQRRHNVGGYRPGHWRLHLSREMRVGGRRVR